MGWEMGRRWKEKRWGNGEEDGIRGYGKQELG